MLHEDFSVFLADWGQVAIHTGRDGAQRACTVLVDRDLARQGEVATVNVRTALLLVGRHELAEAPRRGDTFYLSGTGETLVVDSLQQTDELEHRVYVA
ncbi:MAG: hypothetical protein RJA36_1306 [Pseudomonadota bacterium]